MFSPRRTWKNTEIAYLKNKLLLTTVLLLLATNKNAPAVGTSHRANTLIYYTKLSHQNSSTRQPVEAKDDSRHNPCYLAPLQTASSPISLSISCAVFAAVATQEKERPGRRWQATVYSKIVAEIASVSSTSAQ